MFNRLLAASESDSSEAIHAALESVRKHLTMDVAYVSEFADSRSIIREVAAPGLESFISVGQSYCLDDIYCSRILDGRLPELIADTADFAAAQALPITKGLPIGAHMSVPIRKKDGSAFGMFCCLSRSANRSLNERDLGVLRIFADLIGSQIIKRSDERQQLDRTRLVIEGIIERHEFSLAYQPIWDFRSPEPVGFEVLCRFAGEPHQTPDKWFANAFEVGCGERLELIVIEKALEALCALPDSVSLSVNMSPETALGGGIHELLRGVQASRVIVEVTEHARVEDYPGLCSAISRLRRDRVRIAVDDAGAGFASLQHIIQLNPDFIKLDMELTRGIDSDAARRALASALIFYARETNSMIIAEGIETKAEFETLKLLGVSRGQGFFMGRPMDLATARSYFRNPALSKVA